MAHQEELRKFADEEQAARQEAMVTTEAQVRPPPHRGVDPLNHIPCTRV